MEILKDLLYTNLGVLKKTGQSLLKCWPIIFVGAFYFVVSMVLGSIVGLFGFFSGIIMIAATSALISNYLYLLDCVLKKDRLTFQDFKDGFKVYFRKVWSISFILYLADLVFSIILLPLLGGIFGYPPVSMAYSVLLLIFLNPLPEVIYQKFHQPLDTITYSFEYVRDNWLEWFAPNLILMAAIYFLLFRSLGTLLLLGSTFGTVRLVLFITIGLLIFSFAMIYRGYLFETLSTSNRRKRLYMRKF